MSDFGDYEEADAFDASGVVDPQQVAAKLRRLYAELGGLAHEAVALRVIAWLHRQGAIR